MNLEEKKFVTFNYVRGPQRFLKEAGIVKYASEEEEMVDANAITEALMEEPVDVTGDVPEEKVLEIADAITELANTPQEAEGEVEEEEESPEEEALEEKAEEVKEARKLAASIKKAGDSVTNPKPDQVLTISDTDYQRATSSANAPGTGTTTLPTEAGEIGAQKNVESQIVEPKKEEADIKQVVEGEDIHKKDYAAPGKGGTAMQTETGEIGAEKNVDSKLAKLAMQSTLARLLQK